MAIVVGDDVVPVAPPARTPLGGHLSPPPSTGGHLPPPSPGKNPSPPPPAGHLQSVPLAGHDNEESITDALLDALLDGQDDESAQQAPPSADAAEDDSGQAQAEYPGICTDSARCSLCVSCINWVRRLGKADRKPLHRRPMLPLDNLICFVNSPSSCREPDKRSMFRLLQNMSLRYTHSPSKGTAGRASLCVWSPYLCFTGHVFDRVCAMFRRKYFLTYRFDTSVRHLWKKMRTPKNAPGETGSRRGAMKKGAAPNSNSGLLNDIIRVWWESNGMPTVLQNRTEAKLVRRMLSEGRVAAGD